MYDEESTYNYNRNGRCSLHIPIGRDKNGTDISDRIRDRIRLERFISVCIRVRILNIRYRIRIRILKSYIYDVDIQLYLIRHD